MSDSTRPTAGATGADVSVPERSISGASPRRRGWNARAAWEASARVRQLKAAARVPWGTIGEPTSRLGRLAAEIEGQLRDEYDASKPIWADNIRAAAELRALAQRARALLGVDPRVTLRSITATIMAAERLLAKLTRNGAGRPPLTIAEQAPKKAGYGG